MNVASGTNSSSRRVTLCFCCSSVLILPTYSAAACMSSTVIKLCPAWRLMSRSRVATTPWVVARLPAESSTKARSPSPPKRCSLLWVLIWSAPALVRESDAKTSPSSTAMARQ